jgi:hypothetical protein
LHRASAEMSSHAWTTGATLSHACSVGATYNRSSRDLKLCRLVVLTGGDRDVLRRLRPGGGDTCHRGGVGGWCGKTLHIDLHSEYGYMEDSGGGDIQSEGIGASSRICWADLGP